MQPEYREPIEIHSRAAHGEVLCNAFRPAYASSAATVATMHQVRELSLDLRTGGLVAGAPGGILLVGALLQQLTFVLVQANCATPFARCARRRKRACLAGETELRHPGAILATANRDQALVGAGDGVVGEIDPEGVFGEEPLVH
jgi:hypothetical protein